MWVCLSMSTHDASVFMHMCVIAICMHVNMPVELCAVWIYVWALLCTLAYVHASQLFVHMCLCQLSVLLCVHQLSVCV